MSFGTCGLRRTHYVHGITNTKYFLGGCGQKIEQASALYRCAECHTAFHRNCLLQHFKLDANISSLKTEPSPTIAHELLNSTYRWNEAVISGSELLAQLPRHHTWRPTPA